MCSEYHMVLACHFHSILIHISENYVYFIRFMLLTSQEQILLFSCLFNKLAYLQTSSKSLQHYVMNDCTIS